MSTENGLTPFGWSQALQAQFQLHVDQHPDQGLIPGRVIIQQRGLVRLVTPLGEFSAGVAGRLVHEAAPGAASWTRRPARPALNSPSGVISRRTPRC